ncbi:hypothetical protein LOD99_14051 [Oopsacas minuta]|uniref:Centrosomal protein of 78 kDa n=1 Tax=Oopsacas minuta TaxID=111878 RepID=A0AAV7KH92_9METZ|nr:hypothetical protein LOD99_14051 [Oopsacas minuta]
MRGVQIRQNAAIDFTSYYESVCALHNQCPVVEIRTSSKTGSIEFSADRMRYSDWEPFCNSLKLNQTISSLTMHSSFRAGVKNPISKLDQLHLGKRVKPPGFVNKDILSKISSAIRGCLEHTRALSTLYIEGIPFRVKDLDHICRGLAKNRNTLTILSLRHCCFGDEGTELLSRQVKNLPSLTHLDLTGNLLGVSGAHEIANMLQHQALHRHSSAWEDSLRSRVPHLSSMPGLRRITLNHNPDIGDTGSGEIAEALREDLWVRAVDLQNCGISETGARGFQHCLKLNTSLLVMDLRNNSVSEASLKLIFEQLSVNSSTQPNCEFSWSTLEADPYSGEDLVERIRTGGRRRIRQVILKGPLLQPPFKAGQAAPLPLGTLHKSRSVPHLSSRPHSACGKRSSTPVSARRTLFRPLSASKVTCESVTSHECYSSRQPDHSELVDDVTRDVPDKLSCQLTDLEPGYTFSTRSVYSSKGRPPTPPIYQSTSTDKQVDSRTADLLSDNNICDTDNELATLQNRVMQLEEKMEDMNRARQEAEYKVVELEIENRTLQRKLEMTSQISNIPSEPAAAGVDESTLEAIEESLQQFHGFIDLLRSNGYGHLLAILNKEK